MNDPSEWKKYLCRACGLIYDEALGDPDSGLAPGTRFEDIPEDWECPLCGVTKSDFELLSVQPMESQNEGSVVIDSMEGVVVIGGGVAGWSVVESIRQMDTGVSITLISACSGDLYHKPELSIALSRGKSRESLIQETGVSKAKRLGVRLISRTFVVSIEAQSRRLRTTRGEIPYRYLVMAQGARARVPSSVPARLAWRINHLDAWSALQYHLVEGSSKSIAVLGTGMIGCEVAEDLVKVGHQVVLISRDSLPLSGLLPAQAGQRFHDRLQAAGIAFRGPVEVTAVEPLSNNQNRVFLSSGRPIDVDHLIVAAGLETDPRLAKTAGLDFDQGILVDSDTLRTSDEFIFALGDCISFNGQPCRFIEPIKHQAKVIAHQIIGKNKPVYQHSMPVIRLKNKVLAIELHGTPLANNTWETLFSSDECLILEQYQDGAVSSRLNLGTIPTAYKENSTNGRGLNI